MRIGAIAFSLFTDAIAPTSRAEEVQRRNEESGKDAIAQNLPKTSSPTTPDIWTTQN
ncbi:MAG TPA: hypothetical protein V6C85_33530 [Allocoleopsis sp.]